VVAPVKEIYLFTGAFLVLLWLSGSEAAFHAKAAKLRKVLAIPVVRGRCRRQERNVRCVRGVRSVFPARENILDTSSISFLCVPVLQRLPTCAVPLSGEH
jgi:hypothetical protein